MSDTNVTVFSDTDAQDAIVNGMSRLSTGWDGTRGLPVTVTVDDQPGKTVWTLTVGQRIGVKRHIVTVVNDPFAN